MNKEEEALSPEERVFVKKITLTMFLLGTVVMFGVLLVKLMMFFF